MFKNDAKFPSKYLMNRMYLNRKKKKQMPDENAKGEGLTVIKELVRIRKETFDLIRLVM